MIYYITLFLLGVLGYIIIIGWKQVSNWRNLAFFYLFYFTLVYLFRPLYYFITQDTYIETQYQLLKIEPLDGWITFSKLYIRMGLAIVIGLFSFAIAYRKITKKDTIPGDKLVDNYYNKFTKALRHRLVRLSLVFITIAIISIIIYRPLPGIRNIAASEIEILPEWSGMGFKGTTGYIALAERFIIPASVLFLLLTRKLSMTLFFVSPFILSHIWYGWGRQSLLHLSLSLLFTTYFIPTVRKGARLKKVFVTFLLLITVLSIIGILGIERSAFQSYFYEKSGPITNFWESSLNGFLAMLVGFEISIHWLKYAPEVFQFQWGSNYLYQFLILPIPRIIWPGKRNIFTFGIPHYMDTSYLYGSAPGCIGDAWMNGGWIGIIILFTISGLFLGWIQRAKNWQRCRITGLLIYLVGFPLFISAVRDGLSVISIQFYFLGIPIFLCYHIERKFVKRITSG